MAEGDSKVGIFIETGRTRFPVDITCLFIHDRNSALSKPSEKHALYTQYLGFLKLYSILILIQKRRRFNRPSPMRIS